MFIRSSTAVNDCLIALDSVFLITKEVSDRIVLYLKVEPKEPIRLLFENQEARDKTFDELCVFLNSNYKLRDFT